MAKIAIMYGTTEGQAGKIADRIARTLQDDGHKAMVLGGNDLGATMLPPDADAVIVGASVYHDQHQKAVRTFAKEAHERLNELPTAFFSVSLLAADPHPESQEAAQELVDAFLEETGWEPTRTATFAGVLDDTHYGAFHRALMRLVAARYEADPDTSIHDVHTDWDAVEAFARKVGEDVEKGGAASGSGPGQARA